VGRYLVAALLDAGGSYTLINGPASYQPVPGAGPVLVATAGQAMLARMLGDVAAEIAAAPAPHAGQTYWPTGPERLSYADAAAVLSGVLGRPITVHPLTSDEEKQAMIDADVPEAVAEDNAKALRR